MRFHKTLLLTSLVLTFSTTTVYAMKPKAGRGGPPPEAVEACADLTEEAVCRFISPRDEEIEGICRTPPHAEEILACIPEHHQRPHRQR